MKRIHVIPVGDKDVHCAQSTCWCCPIQTHTGVLTHNAKDCREAHERSTGKKSSDGWVIIAEMLTPDPSIPPLDPSTKKRKMLIGIEVSENFEKRLDNQWEVEREIQADRWSWTWAP